MHRFIIIFQSTLIDLERDVISMNESDILLKRNYLELKEWEAILEKSDQFFQGVSCSVFFFNCLDPYCRLFSASSSPVVGYDTK